MVEAMRPGSVVVDLAAESGGNCELSVAGETVDHDGVTVWGAKDVASSMPVHASQLYARNVSNLLLLMTTDGQRRARLGRRDRVRRLRHGTRMTRAVGPTACGLRHTGRAACLVPESPQR